MLYSVEQRIHSSLQGSRRFQLDPKTMNVLNTAKAIYHQVIVNGFLVYKIFVNPKTPWYVRLLLLIPIAYVFIPTDFIGDAIPILGQLDDLAVLRYGYSILFKLVPKPLLEECRQKVRAKPDRKKGEG